MLQAKRAPTRGQVIMVFVGLALVSVVLSIVAEVTYRNSDFARALLIGLGSSIFGAGLAFFLIEMMALGQSRIRPVSVVGIFVGMAVVFAALVGIAQFVPAFDRLTQTALVSLGASVFGGGLTFFLVEWFSVGSKDST
jgi:protein-S-isoprenylcysteine O-methyltransferase Ste14